MDAAAFLERLKAQSFCSDQVVCVKELAEREPVYADVPGGLHPTLEAALARNGIPRLYSHQAEAIGRIREGRHVVIVTGTASGKTLCYNLPVIETLLGDPLATALYLFPTKALAQDQLRGIGKLGTKKEGIDFLAGVYDGDTPQHLRRKLRDGASVLLTNPDMLHQGILPQHARWNRFFTYLRYIVIDEIHAYRGVFGSNLANVLRRVDRVCRHYGSSPQFICCSATIANPKEHAEGITGRPMEPVTNDGSPRGPKRFVFWNPPRIETAARGSADDWRIGGDRRSSLWEAVELMTTLVREGVQTIAFVRTRLAAEILLRNSRERLGPVSRRLADSVQAYRGGYLPEERRRIEQGLASGEILGVASTNALELGIDIGSLDACILVGYPGTIASLWQQAGRAGRGHDESLVFFVGQNAPMDQYLMGHSRYLFEQNPEQAVVDPDNPHIAVGHIKCAMQELPLTETDALRFGPYAEPILELLEEDAVARNIDGRWYWASTEFPAAGVSLRNIAGPVYTIQDESDGVRVIGTMDEISALAQLHDHAVYLHGAESYFVKQLDLEQKIARVEKRELDYYTQSIQVSQIRIDETEEERSWRGALLGFGDVTATTTIPMFKKIRFHSRDSLGFEKLELPPQSLETVALWLSPSPAEARYLQDQGWVVGEALLGTANVLVEIAPLFVMCDPSDIGATVDSSCLGRDALVLFDRYPGGMGYARRCLDRIGEMLQAAHAVVRECPCEEGCPSCVGSAVPAYAMTDLESAVRGRFVNKAAAQRLLELLCEGPGLVGRLPAPAPGDAVPALPPQADIREKSSPLAGTQQEGRGHEEPAAAGLARPVEPGIDVVPPATEETRQVAPSRPPKGLPPDSPVFARPAGPSLEIAHVLFMDLVGFSRRPMAEQTRLFQTLHRLVRATQTYRQGEEQGDMLRLPRGDGVALVFFRDPLAPIRCATEVARALRSAPELPVRMGIHSGPVQRVRAINAQTDVTGSGINLAQRTMDCGDAGHILLSAPVAEFLKQLDDWGDRLRDLGECEVKHGIRVHLYNFCTEGAGNPEIPRIVQAQAAR